MSVSFGLGHVSQGPIGAVLALPVLATGSLLPSILVHAATDLLTPLWANRAFANPEATDQR